MAEFNEVNMGIMFMRGILHDDLTGADQFLDGDLDFFRFDS